ncbi:MAG: hypothetical protein KKB31_00905 [Nanoarchaeota archaeon]|nr:hypothetical protein [Nanoarchaeota archaeon]
MNGLAKLATAALLAGSLAISGCTVHVHKRHFVRPRIVHRSYDLHHHRHNPTLVICYEWPGQRYCSHTACIEKYVTRMYERHRNQPNMQHKGPKYFHKEAPRRSAFEFQRQESAFPEGRKMERRGEIKPTPEKKVEVKKEKFPVRKETKSRFKTKGP